MLSSLNKLFLACVLLNLIFMPSIYSKESQAPKKKNKEPVELTAYDRKVLEDGEISGSRRLIGSLLAVVPGFGLGHAVQGRYRYKGLVFTLVEMGCVGLFAFGREGGIVAIFPFVGFKLWELGDAIAGSERHNARYHELQSTSLDSDDNRLTIMPAPIIKNNDSGKQSTHLGLALTWNIP
jgi:hypothetical protein